MSYAMMGIPIMLIMLANIGDVLADIFRYVYAKIICCGCLKRKKKKKPPQQEKSSSNNTGPRKYKISILKIFDGSNMFLRC
jgi:hypothetical protein